jgi:DNA-binding protein H-NS
MSDFIKTLLRKNSLRKQCQSVGVDEIEKVIADLTDILEERRAEEAALLEQNRAKLEAIEAIQQKMREAGIALEELTGITSSAPKSRKEVKAKYKITDASGQTHEWTGRGRTPTVFADYMASRGITKDQLPTID